MGVEKHVRVFRNGRNRAVRIPVEFDFPGDEVIMRKEGDRIILEPVAARRESFIEWLQNQPALSEDDLDFDFDEREPPPRDVEL